MEDVEGDEGETGCGMSMCWRWTSAAAEADPTSGLQITLSSCRPVICWCCCSTLATLTVGRRNQALARDSGQLAGDSHSKAMFQAKDTCGTLYRSKAP